MSELLNIEESTAIVTRCALDEIKLKDLIWLVKLSVNETLPRAYYRYELVMEYDREPEERRIIELTKELDGTLFENENSEIKKIETKIQEIRERMEERERECERMLFSAIVQEIKYKVAGKTQITIQVPDDIIEAFNRQKTRFNLYKITLEPVYA